MHTQTKSNHSPSNLNSAASASPSREAIELIAERAGVDPGELAGAFEGWPSETQRFLERLRYELGQRLSRLQPTDEEYPLLERVFAILNAAS